IGEGYNTMSVNPSSPLGKIVPLTEGEPLALVEGPVKEIELPLRFLDAWDLPDFPPYSTSNEEAFSGKHKAEVEEVYDAIEKLEPGTSNWIHVIQNKIGGYESFIQNSLVAELKRSRPNVNWQLIATYVGDQIALGDSGILYVLAGWDDKLKKWQWHCEWQG